MKMNAKQTMCLLAQATLILALGCKQKPANVLVPTGSQSAPTNRNAFLGTWEGKDKKGATYTLRFTGNLQWESYIEENGASRPHYKGTYMTEGSRVLLKVTQEANLQSMGWRAEKGNMPANIMGSISGQTLKVGDVLTDAELKRRLSN